MGGEEHHLQYDVTSTKCEGRRFVSGCPLHHSSNFLVFIDIRLSGIVKLGLGWHDNTKQGKKSQFRENSASLWKWCQYHQYLAARQISTVCRIRINSRVCWVTVMTFGNRFQGQRWFIEVLIEGQSFSFLSFRAFYDAQQITFCILVHARVQTFVFHSSTLSVWILNFMYTTSPLCVFNKPFLLYIISHSQISPLTFSSRLI